MKPPTKPFALCLNNTDYEASLIHGKVYRVLPDARAAQDDMIRIMEESGEDYLYHKDHFVLVDFPPAVKKKILALEIVVEEFVNILFSAVILSEAKNLLFCKSRPEPAILRLQSLHSNLASSLL